MYTVKETEPAHIHTMYNIVCRFFWCQPPHTHTTMYIHITQFTCSCTCVVYMYIFVLGDTIVQLVYLFHMFGKICLILNSFFTINLQRRCHQHHEGHARWLLPCSRCGQSPWLLHPHAKKGRRQPTNTYSFKGRTLWLCRTPGV